MEPLAGRRNISGGFVGFDMSLSAGTRLGPYEVIARLGSGGMGEVYRARDTRLGRDIAIKILPAERLSDPRRRARLVQEASAASALNHPSIVTIHEIESVEEIDFIVMELVPGETLARILRGGALPTDEVLRLAIPVADAGPLSQPGAVVGTAGYLSPEQVRGGPVDARTDVFGFGALLYETVTGRRAFAGDSAGEAMAAVLKEQPRPPSEVVPGIPRDLERIILRCLRKEPARRFQHMGDVKVELLEVKEDSDSQASAPDGARVPAREPRRRRRAWVAGGAVLVAAVTIGLLARLRRADIPAPPTVVQLSSARPIAAPSRPTAARSRSHRRARRETTGTSG